MSDTMLFGVLRMPYELAMSDEISRYQFHSRVQEMLDRLLKAEADAARLDFVDSHGGNWMARQSVTGRGFRVHQANDGKHETARAAIDAAMRQGKQ